MILHNNLEPQPYGSRPDGFEYDTNNDIVILSGLPYLNGKEVKIYGGIRNGDIRNIFVNNIYEHFSVEGRTVVDIGANIADSCIYFALRGANKVIGLEPFPRNYHALGWMGCPGR